MTDNTWTPIPGAIVFDPEKGQRYVYRNGEWIPIPEWKGEPSPLDGGRVPDEPITPEALEAAGWEHHLSYDYYSLSIGTLNIGINPGNNMVVLYQDNNTIYVPGVRTMQQLRDLVEMLGGER